jgi:hypothetical protein
MRRRLLACALGLLLSRPAWAGQHVRVVLDTSISMRTNDRARLAVLSTLLLYDLSDLERDLDDTFEVLTFDRRADWKGPSAAPPRGVGVRVPARYGARAAFVAAVSALPYDAGKTYFYPGLATAVADLQAAVSGAGDVRSIVLLTDGVPEPATRDAELALIRRELVPKLAPAGIRLYVLAFGPEATRNAGFFGGLVRDGGGRSLGRVFVDQDGSELLATMSEIFAQSFGYTRSAPQPLGPGAALDLEGGMRCERAAVVISSTSAAAVPSLVLAPPRGGSLNAPRGVVSARTVGAGYALTWALSPDPGRYAVSSTAAASRVAVLRPSRVSLEVRPLPPLTQARQLMARMPVRLQVVAKPAGGAVGDPGAVDLSFQAHGPRRPYAEPGQSPYLWSAQRAAPPAGSSRVVPEGRSFVIEAEFPRDPPAGESSYRGYLEVEARRGEASVGSLSDAQAYAVDVFPYLAIVPSPLAGDALPEGRRRPTPKALRRGELACTRFALTLAAGRLPHPAQPRFSLRAAIDGAARAYDEQLAGALLTLDGERVAIAGDPAAPPHRWQQGLELGAAALLGEHRLCVQMGRPRAGDPARPLELPLRLTLLESPYDGVPVVQPFIFRVLVDRPGLLDRLAAWITVGLGLLGALLSLLVLRSRSELPGDLAYDLRREDSLAPQHRTVQAFPRPGGLARLFLWPPARPVAVPGEGTTVAWVRPAASDLFELRPAPGVRLEPLSGEPTPRAGGCYSLEVRRPYRLARGRDRYRFQLEYR